MTETQTSGPTSEPSDRRGFRWRGHGRPMLASAAALGLVATVGCAATADTGVTWFMNAGTALLSRSSAANVAGSAEGALVDIVSTEGYQGATAAGTGMVLSSSGEVLTNNHVINGATSIKVTIVSTGQSFTASVAGTDPTDDVAVIQLRGASGLKTIPIGNAAAVQIGQRVQASGNAGGTGETSTVSGTVTGLKRTITASSEDGSDAQQLSGLIETDAPIVPGDSGGALTSSGRVIGMNTAAAATNVNAGSATGAQSAASDAYAIPIQTALSIAEKIENGEASSTIHIGTRGFLGIQLQAGASSAIGSGFRRDQDFTGFGDGSSFDTSGTTGVTVAGVVQGGAAAVAGLSAGDVITSVDGVAVDSVSTLNSIMASTRSGQKVTVGWTDAAGQTHTAQTTLTPAPAD